MNKIRRLGIMLLCMILFVFALSACEAEEPVKANNVEAVFLCQPLPSILHEHNKNRIRPNYQAPEHNCAND